PAPDRTVQPRRLFDAATSLFLLSLLKPLKLLQKCHRTGPVLGAHAGTFLKQSSQLRRTACRFECEFQLARWHLRANLANRLRIALCTRNQPVPERRLWGNCKGWRRGSALPTAVES